MERKVAVIGENHEEDSKVTERSNVAKEADSTYDGKEDDDGRGERFTMREDAGNASSSSPQIPTTTAAAADGTQSTEGREERAPPVLPACDTATLFVGGLHPRIRDLHLQKLFSPYGTISRIHVVSNTMGVGAPASSYVGGRPGAHRGLEPPSKGYAFVEYASVSSARMAMSRINGRILLGKNLTVRPARQRKPKVGNGGGFSNDGGGGISASIGGGGESGTVELRREYGAVQSKIEAVKRAIEEKKRAAAGRTSTSPPSTSSFTGVQRRGYR